jgi:hypothetical protein
MWLSIGLSCYVAAVLGTGLYAPGAVLVMYILKQNQPLAVAKPGNNGYIQCASAQQNTTELLPSRPRRDKIPLTTSTYYGWFETPQPRVAGRCILLISSQCCSQLGFLG